MTTYTPDTPAKPDFLATLERDGFVVVPGVIPAAACEQFQESALSWLEGFPFGFKRDDRSTWTAEHLPYSTTGGLYNRYAVGHEDFVWKIRSEPGIRDVFAQVWGTDDLISSFDGFNASFPINKETGRTDIAPTKPWPHIDQNPRRVHQFELYQGIANLSPNGPNDGGLCVLRGSHKLHEEHFAAIGGFRPDRDAGENENGYLYTEEDFQWYKDKGCEEVKVCANAGDFILWDSRTVHWNASPVGTQTRFVTYVCLCPRSFMTSDELTEKRKVFNARKGTTHWPQMNRIPVERPNYPLALPKRPDGSDCPAHRTRPFKEPVETTDVLRLVGVRA
ncbi:uncharacterized protein LOC62_02G001919 [Vanrija pseudolonga]|uniref:Phytanoyl-CoA dioxygenase n=1 Tax=Vanrija pseudolonga TaxID=143232 RepID=A0AAF1BFP6_9TREE|nr:hypothetical protein LOC62_02G001919 [Vanrija pseudolonga]